MLRGEADVVPEQEEAVAQVDGQAQVFGGGPNSDSAVVMLLSFFVAHSNSVCVLVSTVLG